MTLSTTTSRAWVGRTIRRPVVYGLALGAMAFVPDLMPESAAPFAAPIVSSAFAWGLAAMLVGYSADRRGTAARAAAATLVLAAVTYYCLVVFVSQRWYLSPVQTETGAESYAGLPSVGRSLAFWITGGAVGGAIMGWLGHAIRNASIRAGSAAAGLAAGLLTGEGCYTLVHTTSIWVGPMDAFDLSRLVPGLTQIMLAGVAVTVLLKNRRQASSPELFLATALMSVAASVLLWHGIESARVIL